MNKKTKATLLICLALLLAIAGCAQAPTEAPPAARETPSVAREPEGTEAIPPTPTEVTPPTPTQEVQPTPTETAQPTPTAPPPTATTPQPPPPQTENWAAFCQPSPKEEGEIVANLPLGNTVELDAYLYAKSFSMIREGMMPFTLREIPYQTGSTTWSEACQIHLLIPIGTGPNHVNELPDKFQMGDVVVWDMTGREIRGWQRNLDSYHVRVSGVVVEAYGGDTGLDGSNTIRMEQIELISS